MTLSKSNRVLIFQKYNGKCAYCGCELSKSWHADHIKPIVRNNDGTCNYPANEAIANYNPSCASCNTMKNSYTIEQFRSNIKQFVDSLNRYSTQYKFAKKYGLIAEIDKDIKFHFES